MLMSLLSRFGTSKKTTFSIGRSPQHIVVQHTWVIANQATPTQAFYFRSRQNEFQGYREVDVSDPIPIDHPLWHTSYVRIILIRDIPLRVLQQLLKHKFEHCEIIWFFDDDIPAVANDKSLPAPYRRRLQKWFNKAKPLLEKLCADLWVSTAYLAHKYQLPDQCILPPIQIKTDTAKTIKCFYHGTSSHTQEWAFVITLINKIQQKYPNVIFELIGDYQVYKKVRHIPRVTVLYPMSWENYQAHISSRIADIGLAPLFNSPFNNARSHTKLLDIQRQSAIGIYSQQFPYAEDIRKNQAGFVAENTITAWLDAFEQAINADKDKVLQNSIVLISTRNRGARK